MYSGNNLIGVSGTINGGVSAPIGNPTLSAGIPVRFGFIFNPSVDGNVLPLFRVRLGLSDPTTASQFKRVPLPPGSLGTSTWSLTASYL